jgi:hypothetical protein
MSTAAPYIFAQSLDADNGLPFASITTPMSFTSNDAGNPINGYPGYQAVEPGQTYGLAHVEYTVSPNATFGSVDTISINGINTTTSLSDPDQNLILFTPVNATLSAVPEPSALIEFATAALIGLGVLGWRRRSAGR